MKNCAIFYLVFLMSFHRIVQGRSNMECYRCIETALGDHRCHVQEDSMILEDEVQFVGDLWDSQETFETSNHCLTVAEKVLKFVETEDGLFYSDEEEADEHKRQDVVRAAISSIQFQKRPNSDWVIAEVQLRKSMDVFSFILSDPELEFLNIPYDSRYYIAL